MRRARRTNGASSPTLEWTQRLRTIEIERAIAFLKTHGYRVRKVNDKASKSAPDKPRLNAVGKPYSTQYDPNYRIKHRTSAAHLFKPYGRHMRWVGDGS